MQELLVLSTSFHPCSSFKLCNHCIEILWKLFKLAINLLSIRQFRLLEQNLTINGDKIDKTEKNKYCNFLQNTPQLERTPAQRMLNLHFGKGGCKVCVILPNTSLSLTY